jgi:glycerophosphoryl diester phosphodiesterase
MKKYLLFLFSLIILSCSSSKKNSSMNNNATKSPSGDLGASFDKQGHRGCRGLMPENTIPAMITALGLGVTTLEMDVVITKDKKVILSHEPFFNHEITTTEYGDYITEQQEKKLNIYNMTFEETQKYDVGLKAHPRFQQQKKMAATKPLLSQVFDTIQKEMMVRKRPYPYFNIETKSTSATDNIYHPKPEEFVELLMAVIKEKQMEDFVIIQSFDYRTLMYLHQHYPIIKTALLIEENKYEDIKENLIAMELMPSILSPHFSLVNKKLIDGWHSHKRKVIPWTVNDKATIDKLKAMGVDGIITDYPNLFNE